MAKRKTQKRLQRHRSRRVPRKLEDRLESCEFHLQLLCEAAKRSGKEPARYKLIAGELRVLVCREARNKPILLDLLHEHRLVARVRNANNAPFLPMGWRDDPAYVAAYNALDAPGRDVKELIPQLQALSPPSEPLQLEEFLEHAVAVANERGEYSYKR